jgi:hypothetical protein
MVTVRDLGIGASWYSSGCDQRSNARHRHAAEMDRRETKTEIQSRQKWCCRLSLRLMNRTWDRLRKFFQIAIPNFCIFDCEETS